MAKSCWIPTDYLVSVTSGPASLITLAEAKAHLEIADTDRDTMITSLVAAASAMVDGYDGMVGKSIGEQTVTFSIENAPADCICLPLFPVKSITSVSYYDEAGDVQTIDVANFRLIGNEDYTTIEVVDGFTWPTLFERQDALTFTLLCGFAETPEPIKHAVKLMVGHWLENREAASEKRIEAIDWAVQALVGRYRKGWIAA